MPVYTYRCDNCGASFDRQQSFEDKPLKRCPECGKHALRKLYLPVGIVFKGPGFYSTDSRKTAKDGRSRAAKKETKKETEAKPSVSDTPSSDS